MKESDPTLLRPDIVQSGSQAQPNDEAPLQVMGMISLVDPDGVVHNLELIADENGFQPNNIKGWKMRFYFVLFKFVIALKL